MEKRGIRGCTVIELIYVIFIVIAVFLALFRGIFADRSAAIRALETQGYSEIQIIDHQWFLVGLRGCDGKDAAKFPARAKNPVGKEVECFVCTGWPFKGATIRTK